MQLRRQHPYRLAHNKHTFTPSSSDQTKITPKKHDRVAPNDNAPRLLIDDRRKHELQTPDEGQSRFPSSAAHEEHDKSLTWLTCNWTGHSTTCGINYQALLAGRSLTTTFNLRVPSTRTTAETTAATVVEIPPARRRRTVTGSLPTPDLSFRTREGRGGCLMNRMLHLHRTRRLRR